MPDAPGPHKHGCVPRNKDPFYSGPFGFGPPPPDCANELCTTKSTNAPNDKHVN